MSTYDDGVVARAVAATDADEATAAETELYRRFAPRVRLFGLKHLPDRSAADDLAQQVMLAVITRLRAGEIREPDQIGSFVLGTSRMMVAGQRRGERRRAAIVARFEPHEEAAETPDDLALTAGVSRRVSRLCANARERSCCSPITPTGRQRKSLRYSARRLARSASAGIARSRRYATASRHGGRYDQHRRAVPIVR
jgi:DNA-directed RNA polymerase specialized sigma24 family protein